MRLGVRWTRDSLENAEGVLSNLNHQQIKWAGNWYGRNVRLDVKWAQNSMGYKQGVLSNLGISLQLILQQYFTCIWSAHQQIKSSGRL